jgi:hypothetical protein
MAEQTEPTPPTTPEPTAPTPPAEPEPAPTPEPTPAPAPPQPEPEPTPPEPAQPEPAQPETPPATPAAREEPLRAPGMAALQSEREARRTSDRIAVEAQRRANLAMALGERGVVGGKMKAALRLVDVRYDSHHQPVELDKALETAQAAYDTQFVAAEPQPTYGRAGNGHMPNVHQGARRPAAPDEEAQFAASMRGLFPHIHPSTTAAE